MRYKLHTFFAIGIMSIFSASSMAGPNKSASMASPNGESASSEQAAAPTHIVELFTSQGCSSCPPANKFVSQIAQQEGVLALSYGVTYWDYLGWKDTFGDPRFTKRQREYRAILGTQNIYTPQIILNGEKHKPRFSKKDVLAAELSENAPVSYIRVEDGHLMIEGDAPKGSTLALVSYIPGHHEVDVKRGENRGRNLKLTNVVTDVVKMPWKGENITTKIKAEPGMGYAALFHGPKTGKIISAASYAP